MLGNLRESRWNTHSDRVAAVTLGALAVLVAVTAVATAVWGPSAMNRMLAGGPVFAPPPPLLPPLVSVQVGGPLEGAGANGVNPVTPIVVAVVHGSLRDVRVSEVSSGLAIAGALGTDSRSWRSTQALRYGQSYQIAVTAFGDNQQVVRRDATVATIRPSVLASVTVVPGGAEGVGVGQPVVVRFDRAVVDRGAAERALAVTTVPPQPGAWFWISHTEAHYRGESYWQPGTMIELHAKLLGAGLGNGVYGATDRVQTIHVHDSWIARADGRSDVMRVFHDGGLVKAMPISLGSSTHPSHSGPHVISEKEPSIVMDSCTYGVCEGDPGYYKEKVDLDERISNDGEFVHSAPWSVHQQGADNVSHGCINLSPANARWFYDHFGVGDVVEITNSGGPSLPVWDTYGDWELPWNQWRAGGPG
jgi:lipoprotein-anchoring transpeptidase ErfK/SrfK